MAKPPVTPVSSAIGDYLKAIWGLSKAEPAATNAVAAQLGVSAPSVTGMLTRLQEQGLVSYERYKGARLTAQGEREALRLLRRHRLIEVFLLEQLGYSWDEVHDEAERLEHAVSDRFTERLAQLLGHPTHDPHGDPIPRSDGTLPDTPDLPLAELQAGETLAVSRLRTQEAQVLAYLADLKIQPGVRVTVAGREPLGGLLHIEVGGRPAALSKELALLVRGERA